MSGFISGIFSNDLKIKKINYDKIFKIDKLKKKFYKSLVLTAFCFLLNFIFYYNECENFQNLISLDFLQFYDIINPLSVILNPVYIFFSYFYFIYYFLRCILQLIYSLVIEFRLNEQILACTTLFNLSLLNYSRLDVEVFFFFLKENSTFTQWSYYIDSISPLKILYWSTIPEYLNVFLVKESICPIFLQFGFLFLCTTVASLFCLNYLGLYGAFLVNLPALFLFWITTFPYLYDVFFLHKTFLITLGKWFTFNINYIVMFDLYIDYISLSFIVLTLTIAMFVYIYCFSYFRAEPNVERLLLFINLFVLSMVLLVSSGNFVVMFLGWELIGLTSFFLINFWSTRVATLKAAFKAFTFNKFSDVCILLSVILSYMLINDFSVISFNNQIMLYSNFYINLLGLEIPYIELLSFFLISAAFIKSAQFGTHIWLPDSMEAPVPASALIHSATLVSAGVFLLLRFSPLFELSTYAYYVIIIIGSFTAFFGGIGAAYQSDIKRILAYSTISHCGFLMVCFCTSSVEYTLLYLYIHGFFKAAVFLCVGNVIRFSRNYQDFRRMGGFFKALPLECYVSFICLINLSGLPFTLGFYIKHLLLLGLPNYINMFVYLNIIGGALSGIFYSYRLYYYVFFDYKKAKKVVYKQATENILLSKYYSNTTIASNLAIIGLVIFSYIISIYYFNININNIYNKSEIVHFSFNTASTSEYFYPTLSLLKNVGYVNWLIIFCAFLAFLVKWRYFNKLDSILNRFWFFVSFFINFYLFTIILL